ncbi:MAG: hypothetical protein R8J85_00370 [Mariprofundales bacterium]
MPPLLRVDTERQRAMPSFAQWVEYYLEDVQRRKKRPEDDIKHLGVAGKRFDHKKLNKVTRADVKGQMEQLEKVGMTTVTANRYHSSVRACLQEAVRAGVVTINVAAGIKHYPEPIPRDRTLNDDEMARLIDTVEALPDLFAKTALAAPH